MFFRLKQYIFFGALLWIVQYSGAMEFLQGDTLWPVLISFVVFLLLVAAGITLYASKKKKNKDNGNINPPLL